MKRILPFASVLLLAGSSAHAAMSSGPQLLQALETAIKAKDKAAVVALYNWDGVAAWAKERQTDDVDDWFTRELKSATLAPLPTSFSSAGEFGGLRISLNVQPVGIIQLGFTDGFGVGFPYGKKDEAFYIGGVIIEETGRPTGQSNDLVIHVQTPDGRPLPHATVASGRLDGITLLRWRKLMGDEVWTDGQGRVRWPAAETNSFLIGADRNGFGWLPEDAITNGAALVVRPWGRIEGRLRNRDQALANVQLKLAIDRDYYDARGLALRLDGESATTDAKGRFVFENAPPLRLMLTAFDGPIRAFAVTGGETNHVDINGRGRTVTGHLTKGPGLDANLDLTACYVVLAASGANTDGILRIARFQVSTNGALRTELVEPGDYKLSGSLQGEKRRLGTIDSMVVHVPDSAGDSDAPFNFGDALLKAVVNLQPGDAAPDFTVSDIDGRTIKLSDYHGKYVLLDFWATWCGPCVRETPNMKATYDAFGKDARFALISLSPDQSAADPKKFARRQDIGWAQGFLGNWTDDKVAGTYGVYSIPAIFLIGPDQKVVARDLRGAKIKEAVGRALER